MALIGFLRKMTGYWENVLLQRQSKHILFLRCVSYFTESLRRKLNVSLCVFFVVVVVNFQEVIRNLVKRYVAAMIRNSKTNEGLTEENFKVI